MPIEMMDISRFQVWYIKTYWLQSIHLIQDMHLTWWANKPVNGYRRPMVRRYGPSQMNLIVEKCIHRKSLFCMWVLRDNNQTRPFSNFYDSIPSSLLHKLQHQRVKMFCMQVSYNHNYVLTRIIGSYCKSRKISPNVIYGPVVHS